MPSSTRKLCARCRTITDDPCPTCSTGWTARPTRRPTPTSHRRWRNLRAAILLDEPLCRVCRIRLAVEVDHIRPVTAGGTDDDDNLQPICKPCHQTKTQAESSRPRG